MPDKEIIHAAADVAALLTHALDSGFQVVLDAPQDSAEPHFVTRDEAAARRAGVFYVVRPEWVFGPLQFLRIEAGHNAGKYALAPRVNFSPITIYFQGERLDEGKRRLGAGLISFHRSWSRHPQGDLEQSPAETSQWFKRLTAFVDSGVTVPGGVHSYLLCPIALRDARGGQCLPPFDYIEWSPERFRG